MVMCVLSFQVQAQIVNIEDRRINHADSSAWYGLIDLGFNLTENGNSIINLHGGASIEFVKGKHWFLSLSRFNLFQANKQDFINNGFQHFRYNYRINQIFAFESFTQSQYNERLNLRLRFLVGTGFRLTIFKKEKHHAHLGIAYMQEYNKENDPEREFRDHRLSNYFSFSIQPFANARLSSTSYFQPVLNDFNDLRLSSQTTLAIKLTSKLSFTTSFNITYDSRVPEEVENTVYNLRNGIRFVF